MDFPAVLLSVDVLSGSREPVVRDVPAQRATAPDFAAGARAPVTRQTAAQLRVIRPG